MKQYYQTWIGGAWCLAVVGDPKGQPRHSQAKGTGAAYTRYTAEQQAWRKALRNASEMGAKAGVLPPGPLHALMQFWMPIPASLSAKRKTGLEGVPCTTKPDGDNLEKMVLDAIHPAGNADKGRMVGVLDEDARVARVERTKLYRAIPGLYLAIAPWHIPLPTQEESMGAGWVPFCEDFFSLKRV